jgi:hypothetical protein
VSLAQCLRAERRLRLVVFAALGMSLSLCLPSHAQAITDDAELIGALTAFHGSRTIVSVMATHCYENAGLNPEFRTASDNWYLRNIGFLDLADRVIIRLGGAEPGQREAAETYAGSQIMSAYNQAPNKEAFCRDFLAQVNSGGFDIDRTLEDPLRRAQAIAAE